LRINNIFLSKRERVYWFNLEWEFSKDSSRSDYTHISQAIFAYILGVEYLQGPIFILTNDHNDFCVGRGEVDKVRCAR
jgi:hypothetical protein